jgi:hypothetical protein
MKGQTRNNFATKSLNCSFENRTAIFHRATMTAEAAPFADSTRRGCRSRQPCPDNRKLVRRCPWLALSLDRVSRSRGANRRTRCPAWPGAAPFSVIASPLSHDTPASSFGFRSGNRAFQVPLREPGGLGRTRAWLWGILGGYAATMGDVKATLARQSGSS